MGVRVSVAVPKPEEAGSHAVRILLVEDNEGDIYLLSLALQSAGFPHHLTIFRDGAEAMAFLRDAVSGGAALPELVLLDLNLPRVDGGTLIEMFRAEPALSGIPVILLSSSQSPGDMARAGRLRRCTFVIKPSDLASYMAIGSLAKDFWMQGAEGAEEDRIESAITV